MNQKKFIQRHLQAENPNIPNYVSKIIFTATRDEPDKKFKTVSELLDSLKKSKFSWWNLFKKK